ncbi:MAG: 1-deoxy-D-xylulose-5-phosphate reductoisomerase [Chitinivorax sp.]|mgnify:FL=1
MTSARKKLTVLGSTGSIGVSTLDVVARHPERFEIVALTGSTQLQRLAEQCRQFRPRYAVVLEPSAAHDLRLLLQQAGCATEVLAGVAALEMVAALPEVDAVMAAIVGAAGLRPTLAAARAGKTILLANKETLVVAGALFIREARLSGATLLPIDSEHNAIFQALPAGYGGDPAAAGIARILLTASGGPFRTFSSAQLQAVTPEQACAHPNWSMGRKISVDSASMMNKGLEVIEAHWLFNIVASQIEVVVHPQSVIHSLVSYVDGSVLAQLGNPDMRTPIAHALAYPQRIDAGVAQLDLAAIACLQFEKPDLQRFPCLRLAFETLAAGGDRAAVLNAANEIAVSAFLERRIRFDQIAALVDLTLARIPLCQPESLEHVLAIDAEARAVAAQQIPLRA